MLIQLIISAVTTFVYMFLWTGVNGGVSQNYSYFLYLFMLGCGIPILFFGKNFSSLKLMFSNKKTFASCSIEQNKRFEKFVSLLIKIQFLFALIFMGIASMSLFSNLENSKLIGPNFATFLESLLFAFVFAIIFLPLKTRAKLVAISSMQDDENCGNEKSVKKIFISVIKVIGIVVWVILCLLLLNFFFTKGKISFLMIIDLPSFLLLFLFFSSYLLISGSLRTFVKAIGFAFSNKKANVSEKAKYYHTISGLIKSQLCVGGASFNISCMCMLWNLQNVSFLGINFNVGVLCFLYSVFLSIILLVINSVIYNKD